MIDNDHNLPIEYLNKDITC